MSPSRMTIVPRSITGPDPVTMRALVIAWVSIALRCASANELMKTAETNRASADKTRGRSFGISNQIPISCYFFEGRPNESWSSGCAEWRKLNLQVENSKSFGRWEIYGLLQKNNRTLRVISRNNTNHVDSDATT